MCQIHFLGVQNVTKRQNSKPIPDLQEVCSTLPHSLPQINSHLCRSIERRQTSDFTSGLNSGLPSFLARFYVSNIIVHTTRCCRVSVYAGLYIRIYINIYIYIRLSEIASDNSGSVFCLSVWPSPNKGLSSNHLSINCATSVHRKQQPPLLPTFPYQQTTPLKSIHELGTLSLYGAWN